MQAQLSKGLLSPTPLVRFVSCCTLQQLMAALSSLLKDLEVAKHQEAAQEAQSVNVSGTSRDLINVHPCHSSFYFGLCTQHIV